MIKRIQTDYVVFSTISNILFVNKHNVYIDINIFFSDTTLYDKVYQWLAAGRWFLTGTPVYSTNKTDCHDIAEILLKVALNTITLTLLQYSKGS